MFFLGSRPLLASRSSWSFLVIITGKLWEDFFLVFCRKRCDKEQGFETWECFGALLGILGKCKISQTFAFTKVLRSALK